MPHLLFVPLTHSICESRKSKAHARTYPRGVKILPHNACMLQPGFEQTEEFLYCFVSHINEMKLDMNSGFAALSFIAVKTPVENTLLWCSSFGLDSVRSMLSQFHFHEYSLLQELCRAQIDLIVSRYIRIEHKSSRQEIGVYVWHRWRPTKFLPVSKLIFRCLDWRSRKTAVPFLESSLSKHSLSGMVHFSLCKDLTSNSISFFHVKHIEQ